MDSQLKNKLLKRTLDEYVEQVLDPLENTLYDEVAKAYEALGYEGNDPVYYRGKIAGLKLAVDQLKQLQNSLYKEEDN